MSRLPNLRRPRTLPDRIPLVKQKNGGCGISSLLALRRRLRPTTRTTIGATHGSVSGASQANSLPILNLVMGAAVWMMEVAGGQLLASDRPQAWGSGVSSALFRFLTEFPPGANGLAR
jgi:hypothetical protein